MSTTEDTSAVDKKKNKETTTSITYADYKKFIFYYLLSIIFTISITIFIIGTLGLYTTKVAQANILPDDIKLAPYTFFNRIVKNDNKIDINIMRPSFFSENKDTLSQKATFNSKEYLESFSNSFLYSLKKKAHNPKGGLTANASLFFSSVYDNIVAKNFMAINTVFYYLSYLPESAIMFIYGFFGIFLWIALYYFNVCISIFYHIISIPDLFRNAAEGQPEQWESNDKISFLSLKLILFCFVWWWIGLISIFITPTFFAFYGLISPLFATYKVDKINKQMNIGDFIKNTFAYKQFFFIILATISLFINGIIYLGINSIVGIILAIIFAYFMGLYTNEMPTIVDGFSSRIRQDITPLNIEKINYKNPQLVKIGDSIPIYEDDNPNDINRYNQLTKNESVGGEQQATQEELEKIRFPNASAPPTPQYGENDFPIPSASTQPQTQTGGKKSKKGKKYNIRFV